MKPIFIVMMLSLLAGCATGRWVHPSATQREAEMMAYDCQYMANMQAKGSGYLTSAVAHDQFSGCMRSRGFVFEVTEQQKNKSVSPPSAPYSQENLNKLSTIPFEPRKHYSWFVRVRITQAWNEAKTNGKTLSPGEIEEVRKMAEAEEAEHRLSQKQ